MRLACFIYSFANPFSLSLVEKWKAGWQQIWQGKSWLSQLRRPSVAYSTCHAITRTISHVSLTRTQHKNGAVWRGPVGEMSPVLVYIYTTYMYISQMHFVEGFAAGPNVDRRGWRYRPLSIHVACFLFFFPRAAARVVISPTVRVRSSPHFLLFIHNSVVRRRCFSPRDAAFSFVFLHFFAR